MIKRGSTDARDPFASALDIDLSNFQEGEKQELFGEILRAGCGNRYSPFKKISGWHECLGHSDWNG